MIFKRKRVRATNIESLDHIDELTSSGQPVLVDFWQVGCAPCRVMEGIVDELAHEYRESAHVVKVNVQRVPGAVERFSVRSTPTFVLLGPARKKGKARREGGPAVTQRWRGSGLVKKDLLAGRLESTGAHRFEEAGS